MDKKIDMVPEERRGLYGIRAEDGEKFPFPMTEEEFDYYQALLEKEKRSKK